MRRVRFERNLTVSRTALQVVVVIADWPAHPAALPPLHLLRGGGHALRRGRAQSVAWAPWRVAGGDTPSRSATECDYKAIIRPKRGPPL